MNVKVPSDQVFLDLWNAAFCGLPGMEKMSPPTSHIYRRITQWDAASDNQCLSDSSVVSARQRKSTVTTVCH